MLLPYSFFVLLLSIIHGGGPSSAASAQSTPAATYHNITSGSTITAGGGGAASWPSTSGDFAFGFVPADPSNTTSFLLAVFFPKTAPNATVVWCANGDNPVTPGSTAQLTISGHLTLTDPSGATVWSTGAGAATSAAMLDTGNFVLLAANSSIAWQTFAAPNDTILPSQILPLGTTLRSRLVAGDYSSGAGAGRFTLLMQLDGNLVMYQTFLPTGYCVPSSAYYDTGTVGTGASLVFNATSGDIYLTRTNGSTVVVLTSGGAVAGYYQRATLDADGVFRLYVYKKSGNGGGGWTVAGFAARAPANICQATQTPVGSGACGINSYCELDSSGRPQCSCPPRFSIVDRSDPRSGCSPEFPAQRCDVADESELYELVAMAGANFALSDYAVNSPMTQDQCGAMCLKDCSCGAAVFGNSICSLKKLPLSNGILDNSLDNVVLIKVPKSNSSSPPPAPEMGQCSRDNDRTKWVLIGVLPAAASVILFVASAFMILFRRERVNTGIAVRRRPPSVSPPVMNCLRVFTYDELDRATNKFEKLIGKGSSGAVYEGSLAGEKQIRIAVKKLDRPPEEGEKEFMAEVQSIGQTHHKNLVRLYGYCNEGSDRLLVYEYMSNGTLTSFLFGNGGGGGRKKKPSLEKRAEMAKGIARGLLYLHEECITQILHCDIKSQNVLLDDELVARISDFGMAKLLRHDQTRTDTGIRGTRGYVAPEWFRATAVSARVDVYSFGVLLLEIVCCRRNLEMELVNEDRAVLVDWAYDCYQEGMIHLLVAGDEEDDGEPTLMVDMGLVKRMVMVALWCIQEDPARRPAMRVVNQMLDGAAAIPVPPDPSS